MERSQFTRPDGTRTVFALTSEYISGKPLSEVIANLNRLAGDMNDPMVWINEMGDEVELSEGPSPKNS